MTLHTCTFSKSIRIGCSNVASDAKFGTFSNGLTIGWANVASNGKFAAWITDRLAAGYSYMIIKPDVRTVTFNNATKINLGVGGSEINAVMAHMGVDFVTPGDISLVTLNTGRGDAAGMAETAQAVLDNDTVEINPPLALLCPVCGGERAFRESPKQTLCDSSPACLQALYDEAKRY